MSEYHISQIRPGNRREMEQLDRLLKKEGIERDRNLDYISGLFDENYQLVASGSCFKNTLRCLAVDSSHQGEGLLNQLMSHLTSYQYQRGNLHLFLYTKCEKAKFFKDLGFYEIARADQKVVFMENRRDGFSEYLKKLSEETRRTLELYRLTDAEETRPTGAVVMNANPFTLGHQFLLETASADCRLLHVFLVSEEASLVPFSVREALVKEGTAHLPNLIFHRTGDYMISNSTFPSYFLKDTETVMESHAKLDIRIFLKIAGALGISTRFVGEEPFSQVTGIYNKTMQSELAAAGLTCKIIPRKTTENGPISASAVRLLLRDGNFEALKKLVPNSTLRFFLSKQAAPILDAIRNADEVVHH